MSVRCDPEPRLQFGGKGQKRFCPLPRSFFEPSADKVAPRLLGHWLIRRTCEGLCGGLIVETEAYLADDPACHAFQGETARNRSMFGPPGIAYVYLIYGYHFCVNTVCRPRGVGEAVLIRALEPSFDPEAMQRRRGPVDPRHLTSGPAKLCQALAIDRQLDGADLCDAGSAVFVAANAGIQTSRRQFGPVVRTTRIGISQAADRPLRFYLGGSPSVSRRSSHWGIDTGGNGRYQ